MTLQYSAPASVKHVGSYQLIRKIGSGNFGKAYIATRTNSHKQKKYVIKQIDLNSLSDENERNNAIQESQLLRALNSPCIVKYIDSFVTQNEQLNIVMEYCDGGDLAGLIRQRLKRNQLFHEKEVTNILCQLVIALQHCHEKKIVHRDVKTDNVFLFRNGRVKLGDFGVSKVLNDTRQMAQTTIGTPYYLSPEICHGKPYNHKSDIWALGCILYELINLHKPFDAPHIASLVMNITRAQFKPLSPKYSNDLRDLAALLLSKDPDPRPDAVQILEHPAMAQTVERFEPLLRKVQNIAQSATPTPTTSPKAHGGGKTKSMWNDFDDTNSNVKNTEITSQHNNDKSGKNDKSLDDLNQTIQHVMKNATLIDFDARLKELEEFRLNLPTVPQGTRASNTMTTRSENLTSDNTHSKKPEKNSSFSTQSKSQKQNNQKKPNQHYQRQKSLTTPNSSGVNSNESTKKKRCSRITTQQKQTKVEQQLQQEREQRRSEKKEKLKQERMGLRSHIKEQRKLTSQKSTESSKDEIAVQFFGTDDTDVEIQQTEKDKPKIDVTEKQSDDMFKFDLDSQLNDLETNAMRTMGISASEHEAEMLRMQLENELGLELFHQLYTMFKNAKDASKSGDEYEQHLSQFKAYFPTNKQHLYEKMANLLDMEL